MLSTSPIKYLFSENSEYLKQQIEKHSLDDYTTLGVIGADRCNLVFHVQHNTTGDEYALKVIKYSEKVLDETPEELAEKGLNQAQIAMKFSKSKYICPVHSSWIVNSGTKFYLYILMDFYREGNLANKIKNLTKPLDEKRILKWILQIATGLEEFHQEEFIHRNLKPTNLLLQNDNLRITDFGLSTTRASQTKIGELSYVTPEEKSSQITCAADIWSLGAILYELLTLTPLSSSTVSMIDKLIPTNYSTKILLLLRNLLQPDPTKRSTATEVKTTVMTLLLERRISAVNIFLACKKPINGEFVDKFAIKQTSKVLNLRHKHQNSSEISKKFEGLPWYITCKDNTMIITESYRVHIMKDETKITTINGKEPNGKFSFRGCKGVAIKDEIFYVADYGNRQISYFSLSTNSFLGDIKIENNGKPVGLSLFNNILFITTREPNEVLVYSLSTNKCIKTLKCKSSPFGLTMYNKKLYVCEGFHFKKEETHQIEIFSLEKLVSIGSLGERGKQKKQFDSPRDIVVKDNYFYISDQWNDRIQIWDTNSEDYVTSWGQKGEGNGELSGPIGLTLAEKNNEWNLYVADLWNKRIQVFK